ncbi:MAG: hypothetical protein QME32_04990, partial [Endomicrobiia bacterium]|nr:hypothetical protein [Endomicrobiia bacterium]
VGDFAAPGRLIARSASTHFFRNAFLFWVAFKSASFFCAAVSVVPARTVPGFNAAYALLPAVGIGVFFYNFYDSVLRVVRK